MKVAVLSVTRDRLAYSQECFAALRRYAGVEYDHFVFDNGSSDDTPYWLLDGVFHHLTLCNENIGLSQGFNKLLDVAKGYDVIVKMDNDCQLKQPNTLRDVCELSLEGSCLLSPRILGLNHPPPVRGEFTIGGEVILDIPQIGGIFIAAPASFYDNFRASEHSPHYGYEDGEICRVFRQRGGRCGYVKRLEAWHYERVDEQHSRYPDYQQRKLQELR